MEFSDLQTNSKSHSESKLNLECYYITFKFFYVFSQTNASKVIKKKMVFVCLTLV